MEISLHCSRLLGRFDITPNLSAEWFQNPSLELFWLNLSWLRWRISLVFYAKKENKDIEALEQKLGGER